VAVAAGLSPAEFRPRYRPARTGELRRSCLDVRRARQDLGVSASVDLTTGLRHTIDWLRGGHRDRVATESPASAEPASQGAR
jgi:UDP-glucose 4-epimerase